MTGRPQNHIRAVPRCASRNGLTILELLVAIGVIGVLAGILLPALGSAREAARRITCTSHLKQIGLALHNYHDLHRGLPPGWQWDASKHSAYGWSVPILPFLDQQPLQSTINLGFRLEDSRLRLARQAELELLTCPSDIALPHFTLLQDPDFGDATPLVDLPAANYVGVYGTWEPDEIHPTPPGDGTFMDSRSVGFHEFVNGLSNTFLVGERTASKLSVTWLGFDAAGEDAECRVVGNAATSPNCEVCDECEFSSRHPGLSQFLWGDGRVEAVNDFIDQSVFRRMARRQGD